MTCGETGIKWGRTHFKAKRRMLEGRYMPIETTPESMLKFLDDQGLTLVVVQNERVMLRSKEKELKTRALAVREKPELFKGGIVVDKVVGVAAALLLSEAQPKQVVASVMSLGARERLAKVEAAPYARELVEMILDEKKEGLCPLDAKAMGGANAGQISDEVLAATA